MAKGAVAGCSYDLTLHLQTKTEAHGGKDMETGQLLIRGLQGGRDALQP